MSYFRDKLFIGTEPPADTASNENEKPAASANVAEATNTEIVKDKVKVDDCAHCQTVEQYAVCIALRNLQRSYEILHDFDSARQISAIRGRIDGGDIVSRDLLATASETFFKKFKTYLEERRRIIQEEMDH